MNPSDVLIEVSRAHKYLFSHFQCHQLGDLKTLKQFMTWFSFFRSDVTVTFEDGLFPLVYFLAFNLKVTKDTDFAKTL